MTMNNTTWEDSESGGSKSAGDSFYKRAYLQATHPQYALLYGIALLWGGYFVWVNNWIAAVGIVAVGKLIALATVWNLDTSRWADSPYGKLILVHNHPLNLTFHIFGLCGMVYGLWTHEGLWLLAGISVAALGHLWGWSESKNVF